MFLIIAKYTFEINLLSKILRSCNLNFLKHCKTNLFYKNLSKRFPVRYFQFHMKENFNPGKRHRRQKSFSTAQNFWNLPTLFLCKLKTQLFSFKWIFDPIPKVRFYRQANINSQKLRIGGEIFFEKEKVKQPNVDNGIWGASFYSKDTHTGQKIVLMSDGMELIRYCAF